MKVRVKGKWSSVTSQGQKKKKMHDSQKEMTERAKQGQIKKGQREKTKD